MGSGRDKRKKAAAAKGKPRGPSGADKAADRASRKAEKRAEAAAAAGDGDLDALLAAFKLEDERREAVVVQEGVPPPGARVFASWTTVPHGKEDRVLLFGGERFEAKGRVERMVTFDDLHLFAPGTATWTRVKSPHGPPPRSGHQAACIGNFVYVFGGELTSRDCEKFRHYRDLWRLSLDDWSWEQLPHRGGPAARSGHRAAVHKGRLLLFGGFSDDGKGLQYYGDVWAFDPGAMQWSCLSPGGGPAPRGGGAACVHGDSLIIYGGHTGGPGEDDEGKVHGDAWAFDLKAKAWSKLARAGFAPPPRASFGAALHLGRSLVLWGGVTDRAGAGDRLFSEAHDDLFALNLETRRWHALALRPPAKGAAGAKKGGGDGGGGAVEGGEGGTRAQNAPAAPPAAPAAPPAAPASHDAPARLHAAATVIQARYRGHAVRRAVKTYRLGGKLSELLYSPAVLGADLSIRDAPRPRARASPALAVADGSTLVVAGGVLEVAHTDVTLNDIWALDLKKLDGWRLLQANTEGEGVFDLEDWATDDGEGSGEASEGSVCG